MRIEIGAAIMIQSLFRGYSARMSYYEYLRMLDEARNKKGRKVYAKRPNSKQARNLKHA